ncbi:MAG TPA: copper resistance protein B [Rhodanobacteraceae bacterium]|nr:copper resistance protein B [Rhodanobacteraceae bacterium]
MSARASTTVAACALACLVAMAAPASARQTAHPMDMADASMPRHPSHHADHAKVAPPPPAAATTPHTMQGMHRMAPAPAGNARSPDYSDGYDHGPMPGMAMRDDPALGMVLLDRLEYVHGRDGDRAIAIDGEAWYGRNFDKLWLKFEGEHAGGRLQDLRTEALWSHAVAPFWDTQLGVRHDFGAGPDRTWAAFGIEGLAPYWFETEATLYVGQGGRTAARVAVEYEARFTQRLILQPSIEANLYGRNDSRRGVGSGLSDVEAGLRLRYEIRREFAPYIGVVWQQRFGRSRDYAHAQDEPADDLQFVAGFRIWF